MVEAVALTACLLGGFLRGITGFGGVTVVLGTLSLFFGVHSAIAITLIVDIISNAQLLPSAWTESSKSKLKAMLAGSALGLPLGGIVLLLLDQKLIALGIYMTIGILACILLLGARIDRQFTGRELFAYSMPIGTIMGATSVAIPMALLLFSSNESARTNRANFIAWVFFANMFVLAVVTFGSKIETAELWRILYLAPAYLLGTTLGTRSAGIMDEAILRRIVLLALLALSLAGLSSLLIGR